MLTSGCKFDLMLPLCCQACIHMCRSGAVSIAFLAQPLHTLLVPRLQYVGVMHCVLER